MLKTMREQYSLKIADISVQLKGEGLAETYLNQQQILDVAIDQGCDSVHLFLDFYQKGLILLSSMDAGLI